MLIRRMMISNDGMMWMIILILFVNSEGKLICSPDRTNGSCQWSLFGWETYHGCGYKQKINEHLCIIKNLDGSKSTFLTKMNLSSNYQYCLEFKYLITGSVIDVCLNFYGKTLTNTRNQSKLFATFCIPNNQSELHWYPFNLSLPENLTMINVVTDSNGLGSSNHSLIIKDLSIQQCDQISTVVNILLMNSTIHSSVLMKKTTLWIRFQWIFIVGVFILALPLLIITAMKFFMSHRTVYQQSIITERIQISPSSLSQHFYEEPISIILQPPIDISVYDHVRDNYV